MKNFHLSKLTEQLGKFRARDIGPLLLLVLSYIPGKIYKLTHPNTWIVTEYENDARDNGYWFFKYVREQHPEQRIFYPINKAASDAEKVLPLGNVVEFGSWKHYVLFWGVTKFIGTTKYYGLPYGRICDDLVHWGIPGFKYVFLNHGVARGYSSIVDANETNYQMIVSMSELEKKIIVEEDGQKPDLIRTIGFCRHDNLNDELLDRNNVLIMPTWRNWLDSRLETNPTVTAEITQEFLNSEYYITWNKLLNSPELVDFLDKNNLTLSFYIHEYAERYLEYFSSISPRVHFIGKDGNYVQDLLKQAAVLITDYSSVNFDFAFMNKPVFYYQFDLEEFEAKQYAQGKYYTYEANGFGPIETTQEGLLSALDESRANGFQLSAKYKARVDKFFANHDTNNCKRNYDAVVKL